MSSQSPFVGRVIFENELLTPSSLYGIQLPPGLSVMPFPRFMNATSLARTCTGGGIQGGGLGVANACLKAELAISFQNISRQWRIADGRRIFVQGPIFLNLRLCLNMSSRYDPSSTPPYGREFFRVVMEHEALHVLDETDIILNWLPNNVLGNVRYAREHLINRSPVNEGMFQHWYRGNGLEREIRSFWAREKNRRHRLRDNPQAYEPYQHRLEEIEVRMVNDR